MSIVRSRASSSPLITFKQPTNTPRPASSSAKAGTTPPSSSLSQFRERYSRELPLALPLSARPRKFYSLQEISDDPRALSVRHFSSLKRPERLRNRVSQKMMDLPKEDSEIQAGTDISLGGGERKPEKEEERDERLPSSRRGGGGGEDIVERCVAQFISCLTNPLRQIP